MQRREFEKVSVQYFVKTFSKESFAKYVRVRNPPKRLFPIPEPGRNLLEGLCIRKLDLFNVGQAYCGIFTFKPQFKSFKATQNWFSLVYVYLPKGLFSSNLQRRWLKSAIHMRPHIYLLSLAVCIDPPFLVVTATILHHELLQVLLPLALPVPALKSKTRHFVEIYLIFFNTVLLERFLASS